MKRLLLLALVGLAVACKPKPKTPEPAPAAANVVQPTEAWLRGELPPSVQQGTPQKGGTFTFRVYAEPAGLNRLHDQMVDGTMVRYTVGPVYETLAEPDRDTAPRYELKPLLAESWKESDDHLTLTVKLRKGVKFHDGSSFTAKDVKATVDAILDPKNLTTSIRARFTELSSLTAPDEHTVVVKWKKAHFLSNREFLAGVPVFPAKALEGDFNTLAINRAPIGTGPFKFASWETGKAITLVKNSDYWGTPAFVDQIVVRIVKDDTIATQLWERGEFDLMTRIQPSVWKSLETLSPQHAWAVTGYHRIFFVENNYTWIAWNEERPFFADAKVRRALAMLFPSDVVARSIDMGLELPTTCPYYRESDGCDPDVKPIAFDPKGAKALLAEAGWKDANKDGVLDKDGVPFKFTFLSTPHSVKLGKLVPLLQEQFKRAGIEMDVETVDASQYVGRLRAHEFDAASLGWATNEPMKDNFQVFHSSQAKGGSNYVSYKNPEVDQLLEQIRVTWDGAERAALERKVHRALFDDQVYLFLTNRPALDAIKVSVHGVKPSLAWYDLRKVWVEKSVRTGE